MPAGLGLHEHHVDPAGGRHADAGHHRVVQQRAAGSAHQLVGWILYAEMSKACAWIRLASERCGLVQPVEGGHPVEQVVGETVDDPAVLAVHVGVQPAESGQAAGLSPRRRGSRTAR